MSRNWAGSGYRLSRQRNAQQSSSRIDTDYFETYNRPNVTLVDLRGAPIERISRTGICTTEAEYPVDIIVFATGFDAMTGPMLRMDIRGCGGVALKDAWEAGPLTYLGLQVAGFPNLFTITGPGSPSVLCNMPVAIEQHADWITDCIKHLNDRGLERIEARADAVEKWVAEVNGSGKRWWPDGTQPRIQRWGVIRRGGDRPRPVDSSGEGTQAGDQDWLTGRPASCGARGPKGGTPRIGLQPMAVR